MRFFRTVAALCAGAVLVAGCADSLDLRPQTYVVQPQDTLYTIAWRHDIDFKDLAAWNNIGPGYRIEPGQILMLRPSQGSGGPVPAQPRSSAQPAPGRGSSVHKDIPRTVRPKPLPDLIPNSPAAAGPPAAVSGEWLWPTKALGVPTPVAGGGLMIRGGLGQDIVAAAAGKVVYVGSGIRGYGNLVIIKHSDSLLSAYAHNRELSVKEGQLLRAGERIGAMGLGPRQVPVLYFEIRLNGKAVNVLPYLNKK